MWPFLAVPGLYSDIEGGKEQDAWSMWMVMVGRKGERGRDVAESHVNSRGLFGRGLWGFLSARRSWMDARIRNTGVVDLPAARIHRLQQLVHLLVAHLLSEVRQNCVPSVSISSIL